METPQLQQAVNQVQPLKFPVVPISGALPHTVSIAQPIRLQQPVSASQQFQPIKIQAPQQIQIPQQVPVQQVRLQQQPVSFAQIQAPKNSLGVQQQIQGTNNAQIQAPKNTPGMQQQIQGTTSVQIQAPKDNPGQQNVIQVPNNSAQPQIQVALPAGIRFQTSLPSGVSYQPVQVQTGAGLVLQQATPGLVQLPGGGLFALQGIQQGQSQQVIVQQPQVLNTAAVVSSAK